MTGKRRWLIAGCLGLVQLGIVVGYLQLHAVHPATATADEPVSQADAKYLGAETAGLVALAEKTSKDAP